MDKESDGSGFVFQFPYCCVPPKITQSPLVTTEHIMYIYTIYMCVCTCIYGCYIITAYYFCYSWSKGIL